MLVENRYFLNIPVLLDQVRGEPAEYFQTVRCWTRGSANAQKTRDSSCVTDLAPGYAVRGTAIMGGWEEKKFNACKTDRRMFVSIYNRFPVIRWESPYVGWNWANFRVLGPPLGAPFEGSPFRVYGRKGNSMLSKHLAGCWHLSSTVSKLLDRQAGPSVPKRLIFRTPLIQPPPPVTVFLSELKLENPTPKTRDSRLHDGSTSMLLRWHMSILYQRLTYVLYQNG